VQVFAHGEAVMGDAVRQIFTWIVGLVVVHYLALRRGFVHRCAIATLLLGMTTLPSLRSVGIGMERMRLDSAISIANPNDLGAYFGFCVVYFVILGLETRRLWLRAVSFSIAVGCLVVVGLTVSRAPIFASACAILIACRRLLKRGFLPFLALIVLAWIAYGVGLFDRSAEMYEMRGLEESGRFLVWPLAIGRFLDSPLVGVGVRNLATFIPRANVAVTPHNGFIYLALTSGIFPVLFYAAYWVQLFWMTFGRRGGENEDAAFLAPLLVYAFLIANNLNEAWMASWMVAIFGTIGTADALSKTRSIVAELRQQSPSYQREMAVSGGPSPVIHR